MMPERSNGDEKSTSAGSVKLRVPITRRLVRWAEHLLATSFLIILLMVFTPATAWLYDSIDCQDELAKARYIICLGGDPDRVIEAARLLQEGWGEELIVSNHGHAAVMMRNLAVEWGAPPERILIDDKSTRTLDHPGSIQREVGVDPENDVCIIVSSYTHLPRSKACFEKDGYRHVIMREPRWERQFRGREGANWKGRILIFPYLVYEGAAWVQYWLHGAV
ncbi:MAG: YdcF family protein [Phycisphaerales bacterium]|nr:YdcF family protein [Phycisphaerales bacterium]